jgi:hypothetical protein
MTGLIVGHFECDPHVLQNIMFGLVPGSVAIDDQGGGTFLKRAAKRVNTRDSQRDSLHDARAAPLLDFLVGMRVRFSH